VNSIQGLTICLLMVPSAPARKDTSDLAKMQGEWAFTSCTTYGNEVPEDYVKKGIAVIRDDVIQFYSLPIVHSKTEYQTIALGCNFSVNSQASPKSLNMEYSVGNLVMKNRAIYKIDGDRLTICYSSAERPTQFVSGESDVLVELRRKKR
jgi:uncharacterized protein (TIGR03067 family)